MDVILPLNKARQPTSPLTRYRVLALAMYQIRNFNLISYLVRGTM